MESLDVLRDAISTLPVPAAPPRLSMDGAAVGLGFLDAALRLNHVRRLTERLVVSKHRIAHRTTEVDISLNMLTDTQLGAARAIQELTSHSSIQLPFPTYESDPVLWVPVARLSRTTVGQVDIHDSSGSRLPRLTQYETSRLVASGLYRLLRGILISDPDALDPTTDLGALLHRIHEPRWLIQSALLTVLTEVSKPKVGTKQASNPQRTSDDPYRHMALQIFDNDKYKPLLVEFLQLFDVAVNDHIVVVALDSREDEHLLTYEAPLYVNERAAWYARLWRLVRASREGYYARYITDIPTTLRSYHLIAETHDGVDISQILLTSNAHKKEVEALSRDLHEVAQILTPGRSERPIYNHFRVIDLEIQTLLRQLAELMRRCRWEAGATDIVVPQRFIERCTKLVDSGEAYERNMRLGEQGDQLTSVRSQIAAADLQQAADEIQTYELRYDIAVATQPPSNRAHVYWRRPPPGPISSGRTQIRAGMILRNTAETSTRTVLIYALAVASISYLLACFITKSLWPYAPSDAHKYGSVAHPEAVIGILLLVPGFLYTRLALPEHNTVASHLRVIPRLVAYACIVSAVTLAASVAAGTVPGVTRLVFIAGSIIPLLSTLLLFFLAYRQPGQAKTLARLDAPLWATYEQARQTKRREPDVTFSSTGEST